jgi:uncharacterized protein YjiS (DUF1127 family)
MTMLQLAGATATSALLKEMGAWIRAGVQGMRAAGTRRRHDRELATMSDRELADLGVGRSEVPALTARDAVSDRDIWLKGIV